MRFKNSRRVTDAGGAFPAVCFGDGVGVFFMAGFL
jgi:hypothetical protein